MSRLWRKLLTVAVALGLLVALEKLLIPKGLEEFDLETVKRLEVLAILAIVVGIMMSHIRELVEILDPRHSRTPSELLTHAHCLLLMLVGSVIIVALAALLLGHGGLGV